VVELTAGDARYRDDSGTSDPAVAAALTAYATGAGGEHAVLAALADCRLLVPVVAVRADELAEPATDASPAADPDGPPEGPASTAGGPASTAGGPANTAGGSACTSVLGAGGLPVHGEKVSEVAMPSIIGRDGRPALPAFTSVEAVRRWQPTARPVPVPASDVWQSAVQESCAVVIDIAGPVPVVVEGARLAALAAGAQAPAMHADPDVWQHVAAAAAEVAPGIRVRLSPPPDGLDFTLELAPPAGAARPVPEDAASQIADAAMARLADRVRLGVAVVVQAPG
jgi:hypothetical protein